MIEDSNEVPFFTAAAVDTFDWKVKIPLPAMNEYRMIGFIGRFKYLSEADVDALLKEIDPVTERTLTQLQLAKRVLVGIVQLQGEKEPAVRTDEAVVDQVLAVPLAAPSVFGTYMAVIRGLAPEKN